MKWGVRRIKIDTGGGAPVPKVPGRVWAEGEDLSGKLGKQKHPSAAVVRRAERAVAKVGVGRKADKRESKAGQSPTSRPPPPSGSGANNLLGHASMSGLSYGLGRVPQVVVKTKYHLHRPRGGGIARRGQPLQEHLVYLARPEAQRRPGEEVQGTGEPPPGVFFDAGRDAVDVADLPQKWRGDRHHWRLIVSPQDAEQLDLTAFARGYARRLEECLKTPLEWAAVVHVNTTHPHVHLLVRGRRDDGRDLVLTRRFVAAGLRAEAREELLARAGPRTEAGADAALTAMARLRRATPLDILLADLATKSGGKPFNLPRDWLPEVAGRHHLLLRLRTLERLGFARRETSRPTSWGGVTRWSLAPDWQAKLDQIAANKPTRRAAAKPGPSAVRGPKGRTIDAVDRPAERGGAEL